MIIVIHTFCLNHYGTILLSKLQKIKKTGLMDAVDKILIPVFNFRESDRLFFEGLIKLSPKIELVSIRNIKYNNEADTLNYLKNYIEEIEENVKILYMHTKGVSRIEPTLKKNISVWNRYLDYYCIGQWKLAVEKLDSFDTVGPFSGSNHYSGNCYWINSHYIKSLPYISDENYQHINRGEFWIGLNPKLTQYELNTVTFPGIDFYKDHYIPDNFFPEGF